MAHSDDDTVLAAEYALGTLEAVERSLVEELISVDPKFGALVRAWESRLGSLNQMVGSIEPRPEVWDAIRIAAGISRTRISLPRMPPFADTLRAPEPEIGSAPVASPPRMPAMQPSPLSPVSWSPSTTPLDDQPVAAGPEMSPIAEPAAAVPVVEHVAPPAVAEPVVVEAPAEERVKTAAELRSEIASMAVVDERASMSSPTLDRLDATEPGADTPARPRLAIVTEQALPDAETSDSIRVGRPSHAPPIMLHDPRITRWRVYGVGVTAIAASLVAFIAVQAVRPDLLLWLPLQKAPTRTAQTAPAVVQAAPPATAQYVGLLQRDGGGAPAFVMSVDPGTKMFTIRKMAGAPDQIGRSYELWIVSDGLPRPRSLGVIGTSDITRVSKLSAFDTEMVTRATYAISMEPEGGSPTGVATGPVMFTGKLVETVPQGTRL